MQTLQHPLTGQLIQVPVGDTDRWHAAGWVVILPTRGQPEDPEPRPANPDIEPAAPSGKDK